MTKISSLNKMLITYRSLSPRDRKILIIGIIAATVILGYKFGLDPLMTWREKIVNDLDNQQQYLDKVVKTINSKAKFEDELNRLQGVGRRTEQALIQARDADLASAELIKVIRNLATNSGIQTSRISTVKGKEDDTRYQEISVSIPSVRCDMKQLTEFLVSIKKSPLLLTLNELRIRVTNMKDPTEISVNMEITGYLVKAPSGDQPPAPGDGNA